MFYINAASTISHQNSFQNEGFSSNLTTIANNSELIIPIYKNFIPAPLIRRMSKILRMGVACSKDALAQSETENPDAIIVGTGLGCLLDTEKFLKNFITLDGLIPPTAFIQSTHNTIAGQISLLLKNHSYNMTHTQNNLSFEHALIDGMLRLNEKDKTILVGAADEFIPKLDELAQDFGLNGITNKLTSGASFFVISNEKTEKSQAKLIDSTTYGLNTQNPQELISAFLNENNTDLEKRDLVLISSNKTVSETKLSVPFSNTKILFFEKYCGYYISNSSFGMSLATDILNQKSFKDKKINRILIYNNFNNYNIGLTLLESVEA